jgi:hypothetical protein
MESARKLGYTIFTFHPTARNAADHAVNHEAITGLRAISFTEVVEIEGLRIPLHVMGTTPRPKPVYKAYTDGRVGYYRVPDGWTPKDKPLHNDKLNAFAWFMGEWAAKIKKAVSR